MIVGFNGASVASSRELPKLVAAAAPDQDVEVEVLRDGKEQTLTLRLGRLDSEELAALSPGSDQKQSGTASERLGATLSAVTPAAREQLRLPNDIDGVVITSLDGEGLAADAGLRVGDIILQVSGTEVRTPRDVDTALQDLDTDAALFQISRDGTRLFVGVRMG